MQMNLNILTENNNSSLQSKSVSTADNTLLQYMQKVTQGTNNTDTEDKKQQKLQHIVNKLKHGKKLTAQEMEFLRMNYPDEYQHALRIQEMAEMLENQLKHAKSKQEANGYIAAAVSGISDDDPDKECLVAAFNEISKEFHHSSAYHRLPDTPEDVKKQMSVYSPTHPQIPCRTARSLLFHLQTQYGKHEAVENEHEPLYENVHSFSDHHIFHPRRSDVRWTQDVHGSGGSDR